MSHGPDRHLLLATARADLLEGHTDPARHGIPEHVAASWRRSLSNGVSPDSVESEFFHQLDVESRVVKCAQPVIERLTEQLADVPVCVALTDNRARILARKDTSSWLGQILDGVYFAEGFGYAEGAVGTNGVGTVLEFGESVHIVGAEHFVDALQGFACAGAPVHDPFTGRIEGVLDISCLAGHSSPIMHSLVRAAARQIEHNLVLDRDQSQQALLDMYSRIDARTRAAVVAVGPRVVVANAAMQTLLGAEDREALHDHVRFLTTRTTGTTRPPIADDRIALPSGACVRLRGSTVTVGDEVAGMIGVVTLLGQAGPVSMSRASSPAWSAAAARVGEALRAGRPVLVLGEPGTGRFTMLRTGFVRPGLGDQVVRIDAAEVEADPAGVAHRLRSTAPGTLPVLCDVDRLTPATAQRLAHEISDRTTGFAATAVLPTVDPALMAAFHDSATLPPLRHRGGDLAALAAGILRELAPRRDVRLSDDAVRVLARYRWPGNIGELEQVLRFALRRRPAGEIRPQDLPASCQSAPRSRLRPVDEAERDAIVAAMLAAGGNRKAAAQALGLARSTLYRKIRAYGITG